MLMKYCRRFTGSFDTARDLLHDSFLSILDSIGHLKDPGKLEPWMRSIVRNTFLKGERKMFQNQPLQEELCEDTPSEEILVPSYDELMAMIDSLPNQYGRIIKMSVVEGKTHREIATELNIQEHSSSADLSRARKRLYEMIKRYWALLPLLLLLAILPFFLHRRVEKPSVQGHCVPEKIDYQGCIDSSVFEHKKIIPDDIHEDPPRLKGKDSSLHIEHPIDHHANPDSTKSDPSKDSLDIKILDIQKFGFDRSPDFWFKQERERKRRVMNFRLLFDPGWSMSDQFVRNYIPSDIPGVPGEKGEGEEKQEMIEEKYTAPISISLILNAPLSDRWGLLTGLEYTYLASSKGQYHYLGLPIGLSFIAFEQYGFCFSLETGMEIEMPISHYLHTGKVQYSFLGGAVMEYQIGGGFSFFIEPRLQYYFDSSRDPGTIRGSQPLQPRIPVGLKYRW